ncbi:c-type cytochrome [Ornithinimicrobium pratense]|uniref:Cytochrome bc1 complex cytochrome c subunit n=1 Tax=Ornithinimicrobium pratense TaxID=2593973 RepID=A0A5J6V304_9MICO|nr:c-type cytochrome [Ornithinimicrobium pratense]QFG68239.1 c-type cytochrome [Ornithinimicrobium pratense]
MSSLAARRRSPYALLVLLVLGLMFTGTAYAALQPGTARPGTSAATSSAEEVAQGQQLFLANCASCHGLNAEGNEPIGPSLHGVGAAAVDFQVGTGRMPLASPSTQSERNEQQVRFNQEEISAMAAYVDSLGAGPAVPDEEWVDPSLGDPANGGAIYRTNCAMCHNSSGTGGALTRGKYAPSLMGVQPVHIYEAMVTGPQAMPVFNDQNITPEEKRDVIAFIDAIDNGVNDHGGSGMGNLGPAGDTLFAWTFGIAAFLGAAVWLGRKAA